METPLLSPDLIPESSIEIFSTTFDNSTGKNQELYLIPSPEIWMKKLLSMGSGSIFQICRSFRNREQLGRLHNPEFTMLEWYQANTDYMGSMNTTEELFKEFLPLGAPGSWAEPFFRMSMEEAFMKYTGENIQPWCLPGEEGHEAMKYSMVRMGHDKREGLTWEEGFNLLFVHHVEPELPKERPLILFDYPRRIPTLAAKKENSPWSQRWELYIDGVELANCYTEEADPDAIKKYYLEESPLKQGNNPEKSTPIPHKTDKSYHRYFHSDFPECSGVAMGLDRLLMLLSGRKSLRGVILFDFSDIFDRI